MVTIGVSLFAGLLCWCLFKVLERTRRLRTDERTPLQHTPSFIDYSVIHLSKKQQVIYATIAGMLMYFIAFTFYKHIVVSILFMSLGLFYVKIKKKQLIVKRKEQLVVQFRQALYSLSSSLAAGKSIENGIADAVYDLQFIYPGSDHDVIREFQMILHKMENGETVEKAFSDFSLRAQIEVITNFTDVLTICKRTGGDLVEVIRKTSALIHEKLEIQQDIGVLIAQKRFEAKVLGIIPFVIIAFLSFSSPDYMAPLYESAGRIIMTVTLFLLIGCQWVMSRIMNIQV